MVCERVSNTPLFYSSEDPTALTKRVPYALTAVNQCSHLEPKMLCVFPHCQGWVKTENPALLRVFDCLFCVEHSYSNIRDKTSWRVRKWDCEIWYLERRLKSRHSIHEQFSSKCIYGRGTDDWFILSLFYFCWKFPHVSNAGSDKLMGQIMGTPSFIEKT